MFNQKNKKKINNGLVKKGLLISKTLLFRVLMGRAEGIVNNPKRILNLTKSAFRKIKQYDGASQMTTNVSAGFYLFVDMLKHWANGSYKGFENHKILYIIGALLYLVSPLDIIPDAVPVLGFLDDLSILAWLYATMREEINQYVAWRGKNENEQKLEDYTFEELYAMAQAIDLKGRSTMNKAELVENLYQSKKQ